MTGRVALFVMLAGLLVACGVGDRRANSVRVFAASSLTDAFTEMADAFEASHPDLDVELVLGASSSLREQVLDGADVDVFASANPDVMADLVDAGVITSAPDIFAVNEMVVAVPADNPGSVSSIDDLGKPELSIGLCAPAVPCGMGGRQLLANAAVEPSLDTEEPNVRALLSKIEAGELDAGIVYRSDLLHADVREVAVPAGWDVPVDYSIGVVTDPSDGSSFGYVDAFIAFVLSPDGQAILERHGFAVVERA